MVVRQSNLYRLKKEMALCEAKAGGSQGQDQDHPGQHGETPSLLKIQKLAGCGSGCL